MANLQEKPAWEAGVYQLETSDPVLAGPDGIDNLQAKQLANRTAFLKKQIDDLVSGALTAEYADRLKTPRKIEMTGDGSWNVVFDGSGNASAAMTLRDSGVAPGDYGMVTVDAKGRVTTARAIVPDDVPALDWSKIASGKPATLAGYGIADGASKTDLQNAVSGLVSGAPANLNTLQELAAAVNNDPKFSSTVDGKLAGKADKAVTLAGYGIADAVSKSDLKSAVDVSNSGKADKATTLAGYGITDAQPASPDLAALANLKGAAGLYVNTGPGAATVRSLAAGQGIAVSNGDGKAGNPTVALANTGVAAGTYGMVTVDAMGRVTAGRAMAAADVPALDWSKIANGMPNSLAGYGITDAAAINGNSSKTFSVANATSAAHAVAYGQFASALALTGYQYLPNGMLLQWGKTPGIAGAASYTGNFAIAFPNGIFSMTASSYLDTNHSEYFNVFVVSNTQYRITSGAAAAATAPVTWIAIGY